MVAWTDVTQGNVFLKWPKNALKTCGWGNIAEHNIAESSSLHKGAGLYSGFFLSIFVYSIFVVFSTIFVFSCLFDISTASHN